ncbi:MAG: rhomboid family intramembrane serine protease [Actinobacteria bacterium]|nr:MAG: rhomboid family intramembrane serine protease [Actinomycetota bacterium]
MIPIRDDNPTRRFPIVTLAIIALNVLAFVLWEPTFSTQEKQQEFFFCHAEIPWEISHQANLGQGGAEARRAIEDQLNATSSEAEQFQAGFRRTCGNKSWWEAIFVSMFLHGGWLHIGGNMLFLWVFGNNVEDKLGPFFYFAFYIVAGIVATITQMVISLDSVIPNLGASGAIAGVLGAYLLMFPRRRVLTLVIFFFITFVYLPAFVVLGAWFVLQLFSGVGELGSRVNTGGGVAFFAHIGGFVFGAVMALLFFPKERFGAAPPPRRPDVPGGWAWRQRRPPYPGAHGGDWPA